MDPFPRWFTDWSGTLARRFCINVLRPANGCHVGDGREAESFCNCPALTAFLRQVREWRVLRCLCRLFALRKGAHSVSQASLLLTPPTQVQELIAKIAIAESIALKRIAGKFLCPWDVNHHGDTLNIFMRVTISKELNQVRFTQLPGCCAKQTRERSPSWALRPPWQHFSPP